MIERLGTSSVSRPARGSTVGMAASTRRLTGQRPV
jgi:hypothetical protein